MKTAQLVRIKIISLKDNSPVLGFEFWKVVTAAHAASVIRGHANSENAVLITMSKDGDTKGTFIPDQMY